MDVDGAVTSLDALMILQAAREMFIADMESNMNIGAHQHEGANPWDTYTTTQPRSRCCSPF